MGHHFANLGNTMKMQPSLKANHHGEWETVKTHVIPDKDNRQCKILLSSSVRNADLLIVLSNAELQALMLSLRSADAKINS